MPAALGIVASAIVNIAGSACATGLSSFSAFARSHMIDVAATHRSLPKARRMDSESRFLAIKKFSCLTALRLLVARQNQFFTRIAAADS
jgi:hypothetical protein